MAEFIITWYSIPFIIKVFLFIITLYLYLMICMQFYSRAENYTYIKRREKYEKKSNIYWKEIDSLLEHYENNYNEMNSELEIFNKLIESKKDSYLIDLWIYHGINRIRELSVSSIPEEEKREKKNRLTTLFAKQEMYKVIGSNKKRYGDLNALIMLGELRDRNAIGLIKNYEKQFIEELNFYFGYNIILAYAKIGDFTAFINSYNLVNIPNEVNDDGLFVYLLNSFEGNKELLIKYQLKALEGSSLNKEILAVKYFDKNKYKECRELVLEKLKQSIEKYTNDQSNIRLLDLAMACIRYFNSVEYEKGDDYILSLVDCPIWEVRVVVLNYIVKMDKEKTEDIYIRKITDSNWQIRHNAAKAIVKIGVSVDKINKILYGEDLYAKEALEYAIEKRMGKYELG